MALSDDEVYAYYSTVETDRLRLLRAAFVHELRFVTGMDGHKFCQRRIDNIDRVLAVRGEVGQADERH